MSIKQYDNDHYSNSQEDNILFSIDFGKFIATKLDIFEMIICHLLISGHRVVDIARMHDLARETVSRKVSGIRLKFKDYFSQ